MDLAQGRNKCCAIVTTVTKFRVAKKNVGNILFEELSAPQEGLFPS
jgi:hypothetical protein